MSQLQQISYLLLFFAFSCILIISCNKEETPNGSTPEPEAYFEFNEGQEGKVTFVNLSKNAFSYIWDFGDSTTSTEIHPTHQYTENGDYQVVLEAKRGDKVDNYSSSIEISNVINDSWTKVNDFPGEKRYSAIYFNINNKYYVGFGSSIEPLKDLWEFNPQNNTWTQKNDGPTPISGGISFVINNNAYVGLGEYDNDFWKYDPVSDSWEYVTNFPGNGGMSNLTGATAFSIGGMGYVINGKDGITYDKECWRYDPENNQWERLDDFPGEARHQSTHFIVNNKVYICCGATYTGSGNQIFYDDLWEYNPVEDSWSTKADFPGQGRIGAVGFTLNGRGYVGLGWESPEDWYTGDADFFSDFYEYNPDTDSWKERASFTDVTRIYAFVMEFEDRIQIGTGRGFVGTIKNDMWEYKIE